jgi:hypothetical protein
LAENATRLWHGFAHPLAAPALDAGEPFPVDGNAAIHVYRVVQEALNNVTRHSGARESWVRQRWFVISGTGTKPSLNSNG